MFAKRASQYVPGGKTAGRPARHSIRAARYGAADRGSFWGRGAGGAAGRERGGRDGARRRRNQQIGHAATARAGGTRWAADRGGRHATAATVMFAKRASQYVPGGKTAGRPARHSIRAAR
jgi:hypothetical protein